MQITIFGISWGYKGSSRPVLGAESDFGYFQDVRAPPGGQKCKGTFLGSEGGVGRGLQGCEGFLDAPFHVVPSNLSFRWLIQFYGF